MITRFQSDYHALRPTQATLAGGFAGIVGSVCLSRAWEAGVAYAPAVASRAATCTKVTNVTNVTNVTDGGGLRGHRWTPRLGAFGQIEGGMDSTTVSAGIASGGRTL